jgi:hypothetical protein
LHCIFPISPHFGVMSLPLVPFVERKAPRDKRLAALCGSQSCYLECIKVLPACTGCAVQYMSGLCCRGRHMHSSGSMNSGHGTKSRSQRLYNWQVLAPQHMSSRPPQKPPTVIRPSHCNENINHATIIICRKSNLPGQT